MDTTEVHPWHRASAAAAFGIALVLYVATLSRHAVPGESTAYLVQHLGLSEFPPMSHFVWGWLVQVLDLFGVRPLAWLPNLFSAVCGAGVVAMVYLLVSSLRFNLEFEIDVARIRVLAGLAAAGYAMVAGPIWIVSNRAHPYSLGLFLMLAALVFLVRYKATARLSDLACFAIAYAVAAAEFETCLLLAPPLALYVTWQMKRHNQVRPAPLLVVTSCGAITLLFYLVAAWHYALTPAAAWREFESFWQIYRFFPREQLAEIGRTLPRQGWLILGFSIVLPWLACMYLNRLGGSLEGGLGSYILHAFMLVMALVTLFQGPLPVWTSDLNPPLLVTPMLMSATCFGYAVGYVCALIKRKRGAASVAGEAWAGALAALVVAGGFVVNRVQASTAAAPHAHVVARAALESLGGRAFAVSDGLLDHAMLLEARESGRRLHVLNAATRSQGLAYERYVASLMATPRLQGVALVGLHPMLMEWLNTGDAIEQQLAFQATPDFWLSAGFEVIPNGFAYLGARRLDGLDPVRLLAEHRAFWSRVMPAIDGLAVGPGVSPVLAGALRARLSRTANDLGILLENNGRNDDAVASYEQALAIDASNEVARVNLHALAGRRDDTQRVVAIEAHWSGAAASAGARPTPMDLVARYGHVRTREAFQRLAQPGSEPAAAREVPEEFRNAVALYSAAKYDEARVVLDALVAAQPGFGEGWILRAMTADKQQDAEALQSCLQQMRAAGARWPQLLMIMANRSIAREDYLSARDYLEEAAMVWPSNQAILEGLVRIYLREGSKRYLDWTLQNLLLVDPSNPIGNYAVGRQLEQKKEEALAEDAYRRVRLSSVYPQAQARLALLLARRGAFGEAEVMAKRAVEMDPGLPEGWEAYGTLLVEQGRMADAEPALRKSIELDPRRVEPRLGLARVAQRAGRPDEARAIAEKIQAEKPELTAEQWKLVEELL